MNAATTIQKLAERALAKDGELPLALLLELLAPVVELRRLAQKFGVTPKGGFRIDKAPAHVLAKLLAERRERAQLEELVALLLPPADAREADDGADVARLGELQQLLQLREAEANRMRGELERARESTARARERETALEQRLAASAEELRRAQRESERRAGAALPIEAPDARVDKQLRSRLHELESERDGLAAADEALRRQLASDRSRLRELEAEVQELEALVPRSRRRKKKPLPPPPPDERRFLLPRFTPSFYKSLEGKERRSIERAVQAVLLFCTEGHSYPGLEVKQIGGQDTWSLRASLALRVYFRQLPGAGEIELLELGDREDQNTTLRRLKDR